MNNIKQHILYFFIENAPCPVELQDLKSKYFIEIKNVKNSCSSCEIEKIRIKYLKILTDYDI
jgi:hypothetical protein